MKKVLSSIAILATCILAVSCNNALKKMQSGAGLSATCEPAILETAAGKVPATVTVTFAKGYFQPQAVMTVTPVIVYANGGEIAGEPKVYQGTKIKENNIEVTVDGASFKQSNTFAFNDNMRKCYLEVRPVLTVGKETVNMAPIKVAEGTRTLVQDANIAGKCAVKADGYQTVIYQKTEGRILYDVNSAKVKNTELRSESIKQMQEDLKALKEDGKIRITGTEIISYASPEGGQKFNAELSDRRAATATKAWAGINEGVVADVKETNVTSIGQDWEGFEAAVRNSNIVDKELILRVLSMYTDPAVREKEIRNLSNLYTELKTEVFPDLRRARFITDSEYDNYTDEQLRALAESRLKEMDEPSLLHLATLTSDKAQKAAIYMLAIQKYNSQVAIYNLAKVQIDGAAYDKAEVTLKKAQNQKDADVLNALGVCAMNQGKYDDAEEYFTRSASAEAKENLGNLEIVKGNYAAAAAKLADTKSPNLAIAYIMIGEYDKAAAALKCNCAKADYLRAVVAARKGDAKAVKENLNNAIAKDASLKDRAANDIEFAKYL